jgi:signal transduction histidine kinase
VRSLPAPGEAGAAPDRPVVRALLELASAAGGDWSESIRRLVQCDAEMLHVERVTFWSLGEDATSLHCDAGYVVGSRFFERGATLFESDHGAYFEALREARLLSVEDVATDPRTDELRDYAAVRGITSTLGVPVWVDGRLAGVLCHEHVGPRRAWTPWEEDFAMGAGQVVASTLAARAQTTAETAARRAAFLDSVSRLLLHSLDPREIARRVVDLVVPRFADFAMLWAQDLRGALEPMASTHADPTLRDLVDETARAAAAGPRPPGLSYVVGQGQSLLVADVSPFVLERIDPAQSARYARLGVRSAMAIPLTVAGKTFGVMSLFATDRHYRNEDLALAEDVAERAAAALENGRLYEVARQAIEARDEFLVLAAHELRTPLTSLQLAADEALRRERPGSTASERARSETIARQVRRLGALVEHMLDASRIRVEGIALSLESCDLRSIVQDRAMAAAERARRRGGAITVVGESPIVGCWDRGRLAQVVDEGLDNAIKFGGGKPIAVTVERDGPSATLTIHDRGAGVPPDRLPHIFSPFERAVSRKHFGGLGLGLYIAKAIVDAHGGSIEVHSRLGHGATLIVRLPAHPDGNDPR